MSTLRKQLEELSRLYDIELSYYDIQGTQFIATDDALLSMLRQLGAQVPTVEDVPQALRTRRKDLACKVLEPVFVCWDDQVPEIEVQLARTAASGRVRVRVTLEDGSQFEHGQALETLQQARNHQVDAQAYVSLTIGLGRGVPHGYHRIEVQLPDAPEAPCYQALLVAAPTRAWLPAQERDWGLFSPTYALRSDSDFGVGGLAELERLVDLTRELGGQVVGTLPLNATFLRELSSPSPYGPVSRLFWSELYIDLERLPELASCPTALAIVQSAEFKAKVQAFRAAPQVDHIEVTALLRTVLEPMAEMAFGAHTRTRQDLLQTLEATPHLDEYATFRAVIEKRGDSWHSWPETLAQGIFTEQDYNKADWRYHAYVQVRMAEQIVAIAERAKVGGGGLYLDLPLGVHPDGYDAWRFKDQFLSSCSAGAPPDDLFAGGQDWGFRPLNPHTIRESGYEYVVACLRKQFESAGALRVDHVMGLHRLFCIPHGMDGTKGLYVRYRAEELYAILTLESHRNQCFVIGEDLGTVPDEVREAMERHGLLRMYVMQFALSANVDHAVAPPPAQAVASVNTHDTPTFASFWQDEDIDTRLRLEHCTKPEAKQERAARKPMREAVVQYLRDQHVLGEAHGTANVLGGALNYAASSDARLLLVNLEDLWGETHAQNVPGTVDEHANWQNRCQHALEKLPEVPGLIDTLREIDRRRRR